jgi:hypothetical protein
MAELEIRSVSVRPPEPVPEEKAERGVQERLHVAVELKNESDKPLHVWTSRRSYDYDPATRVLTVELSDKPFTEPPGITLISKHPRVPNQVVVETGGTRTIEVPVPTTIRRRVPGEGLGMSFVEEPIADIDHVDLHVQYSDVPFQHIVEEHPEEHQRRLAEHGSVVRATVKPITNSPRKEH